MTSVAASGASPRHEILVDAALALPLAALAIGGTAGELVSATTPTPPPFGGYLIAFAASATLIWRRQRPALVAVGAMAIAACYPLIGYPGFAPMLPMFVALFSLAAYGATQRALYGALALCVITYLLPVVSTQRWSPWSPAVWAPAVSLVWVSLLGASSRRRRLASEEHVRQVAEVAEAQARERMAGERLQVARELHDVLAHTISVIAVQSGLAVDALDDDTDTTRRALGTIRASTKEALAELRATLTLLRADANADSDADTADGAAVRPTRPQPRLADLPDLIAQTRAAGLAVTLSCELDGPGVVGGADGGGVDRGVAGPGAGAEASDDGGVGLSPALELTAFRVVQESLTNVVRHAKATSVAVEVRRHGDQLHITVADDGHGPQGDQTGFGVRGMRERVAAHGGTFVAGPGPGQGYEVRAVLPL